MNIYGLQKLTLLDYPGHTACTVFTKGCNFRCSYCHNQELAWGDPEHLMSQGRFFQWLETRRGILDGVAITGGEPTLQSDLARFMERIHDMGFKAKLDTNGSFPMHIQAILNARVVDYIAMDVKSNPMNYSICGIAYMEKSILESISLIMNSGVDYEFRTTVVPQLQTLDDFRRINELISGAKRYFLQAYRQPKNSKFYFDEPDRKYLERIKSVMSVSTFIRGI